MKLNKFLWNSFLTSEEGKKSTHFFDRLRELYEKKDSSLVEFLDHWNAQGSLRYVSYAHEQIEEAVRGITSLIECQEKGFIQKDVDGFKAAKQLYYDISNVFIKEVDGEEQLIFKRVNVIPSSEGEDDEVQELEQGEDEFDLFALGDIENLSIALSCLYPKYFFLIIFILISSL